MPFGPGLELLDAGFAAQALQGDDLQQVVDLGREGAEAVDQFGGHGFALGVGGQGADAAVEAEADGEVGDVGLGDQHGEAELDVGGPVAVFGALAAAFGAHLDRPRPPASAGRARCRPRGCGRICSSPSRLPAPRMSRSWRGEGEAGAEVVERLHDVEALLGGGGEAVVGGPGEVGVAALLAAADPAAELVELAQAEHVGAVDDQRVDRRHVEAGSRRCWWRAGCRICRRRTRS